jgi:hypothetical protein
MFKWLSEASAEKNDNFTSRDYTSTDSGCTRDPSPVPRPIMDAFNPPSIEQREDDAKRNVIR